MGSRPLQKVDTIPRYFRNAGYHTVGAGKLFHSSTWNTWAYYGYNDTKAWDAYFPSLDRQVPHEVMPHVVPANGTHPRTFDWSPVAATDEAMGDGQVATWSAEQLLEPVEGPRFNAMGIYRPHLPWFLPRKYFEMHPLDEIVLPDVDANDLDDLSNSRFKWVQEDPEGTRWKQVVQGYLASVSFADVMVGKVLDALDASGRADDTIVVLWTDHGFHLGEKARIGKGTLWRESTRVPFIVVAPGVTKPGTRSNTAVSLMDMYPTLAELAGLAIPGHIEGTSLVPILKDPSRKSNRAVVSTNSAGNHAVSGDRFRYLSYKDGSEELYDIQNDPNELINLANDPKYAAVKAELSTWLPKHDTPDLGRNRDTDEFIERVSDITLP